MQLVIGRATLQILTFAERPELAALAREIHPWPAYQDHGVVVPGYWRRLNDAFPAFQFVLYDQRTGTVLGKANSVPCWWDGSLDGLPNGIDDLLIKAFELQAIGGRPNALSALAIALPVEQQGKGLSRVMVEAMIDIAAAHGFANLIAPVRPNWKERYPSESIERYVARSRDDGLPFDPWIRVHVRMGAEILKPAPRSMEFRGTIGEWEEWTNRHFERSGDYEFPHGLARVTIDLQTDTGQYWEPNVWVRHAVRPLSNGSADQSAPGYVGSKGPLGGLQAASQTMDEAASIREAKLDDAPDIARVHIETWQVAYRGQLPDEFLDGLSAQLDRRRVFWERWIASVAPERGQTAIVAELGGRVVGFVTFGPAEDEPRDPQVGEIYAIYLEPPQWNRGYGRALFAAAVDGLRARGYGEATLWVLETNQRTRRFYEIAGWVTDGTVKVVDRGEVRLHEVRYRRELRL